MAAILHIQKYLNNLINEIINKKDVHNWTQVSILLAIKIEEQNTNNKHR